MEVSDGLLAVMIDDLFFLRAETLIHTNALNHEKANERGPRGWMAASAWNDATGRGGNDACDVRIGHRARRQRVWKVASPRSRS